MSNKVSLSDLINNKFNENEFFFSIELFPPQMESDLINLYSNLNEFLNKFRPLFCDITYHSKSQKPIEHPCSSFSIANYLNQNFNLNSVLHFTCVGKNLAEIDSFLDKTKELDIRNLFVLRGDKSSTIDNCTTQLDHHFNYANELVSYIRDKTDNFYTICVASYPNKHSEAKNLIMDINYLKKKLEKSDYSLTQIIFKADDFIEFIKKCRDAGIKKPIIPGILPVYKLDSLKQITKFCKVNVPDEFIDYLNQNNDENNFKFSIKYFVNLAKELIESKSTAGIHFYTMNDFKLVENILNELKFNLNFN